MFLFQTLWSLLKKITFRHTKLLFRSNLTTNVYLFKFYCPSFKRIKSLAKRFSVLLSARVSVSIGDLIMRKRSPNDFRAVWRCKNVTFNLIGVWQSLNCPCVNIDYIYSARMSGVCRINSVMVIFVRWELYGYIDNHTWSRKRSGASLKFARVLWKFSETHSICAYFPVSSMCA